MQEHIKFCPAFDTKGREADNLAFIIENSLFSESEGLSKAQFVSSY